MNKQVVLCLISIVLCCIVGGPQILAALSASSEPADSNAIISVQTQTVEETLASLNMAFPAVETTTVESFANGSTEATITVNMTLTNGGVCMTMNTMLPAEGQQTQTTTNTQNEDITDQNETGLWPWCSRNDTVFFLDTGNNGTDIVSYDHPDNYDVRGYFPGEPYLSFMVQGAVREHIHIPTNVLAAWINGNISSSTALSDVLEIGGGFAALFGGIAESFDLDVPGAWAAIVGGLAALVDGFAKLLGFSNTAAYMQNTVEEQDNRFKDGWMWQWGFERTGSYTWIFNPPIVEVTDPSSQSVLLNEFHRVGIGFEQTVQFQQAMGADYDSPQTITTQVWGLTCVPGLFSVSTTSK